jgi:hypothetical protein
MAHLDQAYLLQVHKQNMLQQLGPASFILNHMSEPRRPNTRRKHVLSIFQTNSKIYTII